MRASPTETAKRSQRAAAVALLGCLASCAEDRILPVDSTCGDLLVQGQEECDSEAPGCSGCRIAEGWECPDNACHAICGDQRVVEGEDCDPPDGVVCDSSCRASVKLEPCNLGGHWIARQTDFSRDAVVGEVQTSSNWYYLEIAQEGERFTVKRSLNCGLEVTGTVHVTLTPGGFRSLLSSNPQDGSSGRRPRHGSFREEGDHCELSMSRHYFVRGVPESYLPDDFDAELPIESLAPKLPTKDEPEGAIDADGDEIPGLTLDISGNASGKRHVAQRDWVEYRSVPGYPPIPRFATELVTRSFFDNEESILAATECSQPLGCALLEVGSSPDPVLEHRVRLRWLANHADDPRVVAIVAGTPHADLEQDLLTCARVREALPHDPASE